VVKALKRIMEQDSPVSLLLENSAGAGQTVGASLEEIAEIIGGAGRDPRLGLCFDSCHGFAAGYDFRSEEKSEALAEKMNLTVGLDRLRLFHFNDCSAALGSHLDRHQHIGKGEIGLEGFRSLLQQQAFQSIPIILETPKKGPKDDLKNLSCIRGLFHLIQQERTRRKPLANQA
jgi:deoxyribonuclease-4